MKHATFIALALALFTSCKKSSSPEPKQNWQYNLAITDSSNHPIWFLNNKRTNVNKGVSSSQINNQTASEIKAKADRDNSDFHTSIYNGHADTVIYTYYHATYYAL